MKERESGFISRYATDENASPIKLHISIDAATFQEMIEVSPLLRQITDVLNEACDKNIITGYKFIDDPRLYLSEIEAYRRQLDDDETKDKMQLQFLIDTRQRLVDGDQFTLYLPDKVNDKKLLALLQKLENILSQVKPGRFAETEIVVAPHISVRKDIFDTIEPRSGRYKNEELAVLSKNKLAIELNNRQVYVSSTLPLDIGNPDYKHDEIVEFLRRETIAVPLFSSLVNGMGYQEFMNEINNFLIELNAKQSTYPDHVISTDSKQFSTLSFVELQKKVFKIVKNALKNGISANVIAKELEQEDIKKLLDIPDNNGKNKYRDEINSLLKPHKQAQQQLMQRG